MGRRRIYFCGVLAVTAIAAGALIAVWATSAKVPEPQGVLPTVAGGAPADFISLRDWPPLENGIALSSSTTGALARKLLPASLGGMTVTGLSLDSSGNLWITYSGGPQLTSGVMGGDPRPGSCSNEIVVWHKGTRQVSVFLRPGRDVLVAGATLSPDRKLLAYTESSCASLGTDYIRVTAVATGRSWTAGQALPRCHALGGSWTSDSRSLILRYAPATVRHYTGSGGTCEADGRGELLVIDAKVGQPGVRGRLASADSGCEINAAAGMAGAAVLAIEDCGQRGSADWSNSLLVLDSHLRLMRRIGLGSCTEVGQLSADAPGTSVLLYGDNFCASVPAGPASRLWLYTSAGGLRLITATKADLGISGLTW